MAKHFSKTTKKEMSKQKLREHIRALLKKIQGLKEVEQVHMKYAQLGRLVAAILNDAASSPSSSSGDPMPMPIFGDDIAILEAQLDALLDDVAAAEGDDAEVQDDSDSADIQEKGS